MSVLSAAVREQVGQRLSQMMGPVVLRVPAASGEIAELAAELTGTVESEEEALLTVEPWEGESLTLLDGWGRETGIHFRDIPVGQELTALVDAILAVSKGTAVLSPLGRSQAQSLPAGSEVWIFVTPSCPRCSAMVRLANEIALESRGNLRAVTIDLTHHPEMVGRFNVLTAPYFVVGGKTGFPGPLPELILLQRIADVAAV